MKTRVVLIIVAVLTFICASAGRQALAANRDPEAVLKAAGLVRMGGLYVLPVEQKLDEDVRAARKAKATLQVQMSKRTKIQGEIDRANNMASQWATQYDNVNGQMARISKSDVDRYNALVGQVNGLMNRIREADKFVQQREQDLAKVSDSPDDYINLAVNLADRMEAADKQYDVLAADRQVQAALAAINAKEAIKVKLGPSAEFTEELPRWRQARSGIDLAVVKLDMSESVPQVEVTLDGTLKQKMVLDSGASSISITADVARKLGMKPGPRTPTIQMSIANGSKVEGKIMRLKSVRVGQFTVKNVICTVLPASAQDAPCLLGGTFLRHFVYRADLTAGVLHLAELRDEPEGAKVNAVSTAIMPGSAAQAASPTGHGASGTVNTGQRGAALVVPTGPCKIMTGGGLCLAVSASSRDSGTGAIVWTATDKVQDQQWTVVAVGDNYVSLRNQNSGLVLGVKGATRAEGAAVIQSDATNGDEQQWMIEPAFGHAVRIVNKNSGLCLTAQGSGGNGMGVVQAQWDQKLSQLWEIVPSATGDTGR